MYIYIIMHVEGFRMADVQSIGSQFIPTGIILKEY